MAGFEVIIYGRIWVITEDNTTQGLIGLKEPLKYAKLYPKAGATDLHKAPGWNTQFPQEVQGLRHALPAQGSHL
jgi:hypothetical protein